jgi:probable DNA metabolism protein
MHASESNPRTRSTGQFRLDGASAEPPATGSVTGNPLALDNVAYLHDGTLEGLFSAVFEAYVRHEQPTDIAPERRFRPRLGQSELRIATNTDHAERVRRGIIAKGDNATFRAVVRAAVSDDPSCGIVVFRFIRQLMSPSVTKRDAARLRSRLADPIVADLHRLEHLTLSEEENMRQFVRFVHWDNGIWFARCNPAQSVVPLVMGYFVDRFNDQPFIIYDENHRLAGVWDTTRTRFVRDVDVVEQDAAPDDALYQEAWKRFYDATSIDARYHPELRDHFIPVRLWRNLTEFKPRRTEFDYDGALHRASDGLPQSDRGKSADAALHDSENRPDLRYSEKRAYDALCSAEDRTDDALRYSEKRADDARLYSECSTPVPSHTGMKLSSAAGPSCQK